MMWLPARAIIALCLIVGATSANLKASTGGDDQVLERLRRDGYKPLGSGYWQNSFDYFFASGSTDPKRWLKIGDVSGNLKNLGAGYAVDAFNGYFRGREIEISGNLKVLKAYKALTYYAVDSFNAFYKGKKIEVSGNLKSLGFGYATDSFNAYFHGEKMPDVMGKLKVTRCGYATDATNAYFGSKKIESAQGEIKCIGGGYGVDAGGNKFYKGSQVESVPARFIKKTTLTHIGGGYALSTEGAYYRGKRFGRASPGHPAAGLKVLKGPKGLSSSWAISKLGYVYYKGEKIDSLMHQKLTLLNGGWMQTNHHQVFYKGRQVNGVVGRLKVLASDYATDQMNAYYHGEKIDIMGQASSFKLIGGSYAATQSFAFYKGEKIRGCANPERVYGSDYLKCFGSVFYKGEKVRNCLMPKKCVKGYLECQHSYIYDGEKVRHAMPTLNPLTFRKDGEVVDSRGKKYVDGERE